MSHIPPSLPLLSLLSHLFFCLSYFYEGPFSANCFKICSAPPPPPPPHLPCPPWSSSSAVWPPASLWEVMTSWHPHLGLDPYPPRWVPREGGGGRWLGVGCGPWCGDEERAEGKHGILGLAPTWGWAHAGLPLSVPAAWPRYRVVGSADAGQYNLEITDAELSDDASYECQATEAALRSRRAKLTVLSNSLTRLRALSPLLRLFLLAPGSLSHLPSPSAAGLTPAP